MAIKPQKLEDRKEGVIISKYDMDMRGAKVYSSTVLVHHDVQESACELGSGRRDLGVQNTRLSRVYEMRRVTDRPSAGLTATPWLP